MKPRQPAQQAQQSGGIYACKSREQLIVFLEVQAARLRPAPTSIVANGAIATEGVRAFFEGQPASAARRAANPRYSLSACTTREQLIAFLEQQDPIAESAQKGIPKSAWSYPHRRNT